MKNRKIYIVLGLLGLIPISMFVISMLFVVTSDAQGWVYESYCNNSEHEKAHKKFYGKEVGSKECFDYANKHFDEINSDNTLIYPNPIGNEPLTIKFDSEIGKVNEILVSDNQGKVVKKLSVNIHETQKSINLEGISKGVYYIHLITDVNKHVYKILKH